MYCFSNIYFRMITLYILLCVQSVIVYIDVYRYVNCMYTLTSRKLGMEEPENLRQKPGGTHWDFSPVG